MSTAAIICVAGNAPETWSADDEADFRRQIDAFDAIRIMPSEVDAYLLQCLWLDLMVKGMTEVVIGTAEFTASGKLEIGRRFSRLPGITMN